MIGLIIFSVGLIILSLTIAIHLILSIEGTCLYSSEGICATGYNFYNFPFFELLIASIIISIFGIMLKIKSHTLSH
ncbi:MAG: hypothetical protein KatS3mg003_2283 [Candidatus Nitrosocaldaceae archaeon]|nr:MAG: hypothetical protein KatS3mg003_2283 [Candidatus Nitrosocaldaceae archaeon]